MGKWARTLSSDPWIFDGSDLEGPFLRLCLQNPRSSRTQISDLMNVQPLIPCMGFAEAQESFELDQLILPALLPVTEIWTMTPNETRIVRY